MSLDMKVRKDCRHMAVRLAVLMTALVSLTTIAVVAGPLPRHAPEPQARPRIAGEEPAAQLPPGGADAVPVPAPRPPVPGAEPDAGQPRPVQGPPLPTPQMPPVPTPSPDGQAAPRPPAPDVEPDAGQPRPVQGPPLPTPQMPPVPTPSPDGQASPRPEIPPRPETSPAEEAACRKALEAMGALFVEKPPLADPQGCSLPAPLVVERLTASIAVEPPALVNCATAEAVARFAEGTVSKLAEAELGSKLKSIAQASGYVCRPRNGTHKLSEHAFGNALDIASFTLVDGTVVEIAATRNPRQSTFLSKVRAAACGPFKTVLGPGSDADHATHFHFDLAKRRGDRPFCQ